MGRERTRDGDRPSRKHRRQYDDREPAGHHELGPDERCDDRLHGPRVERERNSLRTDRFDPAWLRNRQPVRDQRRRRHGAVDGPRQPSCGLPFGVWDVLLEQRAVLHPPDRHDGENNRVQQLRDRERRARRLPVPCRPLCEPDRSEGSGDCARGPIPDSDGPASHLQPDDHLAGGALRRRELVVPCAQPGHALSGPVGHADTDRRGEVGDRLERCADRRAFARGIHNSNNYCGCRSCGAVLLDGLVHGDFAAGILPGSVRAGVGRSEQPHFQPAE